VRSQSPFNVQAAKLVAEMAAEVGVEFDVQVVSTDKLYDLTVRKVDGEPAPAFDTFIWGWGGDPYDPSFLLSVLTTDQIGGSSDSFYSNAEYDRLFDEQSGSFDTEERKAIIQRMVAITQRDLPYLVLTYDPNLEAYRTDRLANVEPVCPAGESGDVFCDQVSYEPLLTLAPGTTSSDDDDGGAPTGLIIVAAIVVLAGVAYLVVRSRRRGREPLELEE
jgi:peptide/nickel transport system substrate-binding protein